MIETDVQKAAPGAMVVLYELNAIPLGGSRYYFTPYHNNGAPIRWGGIEYTPIDIEADGFGQNAKGSLPRPRFRITNVNPGAEAGALMSAVIQWDDLLGAIVTRRRTLVQYLDGQPQADPEAGFPEDVYLVARKISANRHQIEWELEAFLDSEGVQLPKRQILRDNCTFEYRKWVDTGFVYPDSENACPYTGTLYFDADGKVVAATLDHCGRKLADCRKRYPGTLPLPFRGFPGTGRTRV